MNDGEASKPKASFIHISDGGCTDIHIRYITHSSKKSWKTRKETSLILYYFLFHFLLQQLSEDIGYVLYSALGSFYIPSCIMVFVYIRIYYAAKARARRGIRKQPRKPPNEQVSENSSPSHSPHRHNIALNSTEAWWKMLALRKQKENERNENERRVEECFKFLMFSSPLWMIVGSPPFAFLIITKHPQSMSLTKSSFWDCRVESEKWA